MTKKTVTTAFVAGLFAISFAACNDNPNRTDDRDNMDTYDNTTTMPDNTTTQDQYPAGSGGYDDTSNTDTALMHRTP